MNANLAPLCDANLQQAALREVMTRIKTTQERREEPRGVPPSSEQEDSAWPPAISRVLSDQRAEHVISRLMASNAVRVLFDVNTLAHPCERIERQWWEEALLHYFLSAQASTIMIQT